MCNYFTRNIFSREFPKKCLIFHTFLPSLDLRCRYFAKTQFSLLSNYCFLMYESQTTASFQFNLLLMVLLFKYQALSRHRSSGKDIFYLPKLSHQRHAVSDLVFRNYDFSLDQDVGGAHIFVCKMHRLHNSRLLICDKC